MNACLLRQSVLYGTFRKNHIFTNLCLCIIGHWCDKIPMNYEEGYVSWRNDFMTKSLSTEIETHLHYTLHVQIAPLDTHKRKPQTVTKPCSLYNNGVCSFIGTLLSLDRSFPSTMHYCSALNTVFFLLSKYVCTLFFHSPVKCLGPQNI